MDRSGNMRGPGAHYRALRDLWPLARRPRFRLRRTRILPGPLQPLQRPAQVPVRRIGLGLVLLSAATSLILAPQIRATVPLEASSLRHAELRRDPAQPVQSAAIPTDPLPVGSADGSEAERSLRPMPAEAMEASETAHPASVRPDAAQEAQRHEVQREEARSDEDRRSTSPALFEPLPTLDIDEASFDAVPALTVEHPPRPGLRLRPRP